MKKISDKLLERYSRQIIISEVGISGQQKIFSSSITIIGCGGLGTSAAQYLSMAGVGNIKLIDNDTVSNSNLNRQTLFNANDIGKKKVNALNEKLLNINNVLKTKIFDMKVDSNNIEKLVGKDEIVLDCTDNFESKYLINKYSVKKKKVLITAALQNFEIQALAIAPWKNKDFPCYECLFPFISENIEDQSCEQMGIMAQVAGMGGIVQANFALNIILGQLGTVFKELLLINCLTNDFKKIKTKKNLFCKICHS